MALASACAPGSNTEQPKDKPKSSISTDVAKAGDVTLTVWDQEVRGSQNKAMTKLNEEFQEKYPNVKIKRVSKEFGNLKDTLKLALSGKKPPDVVQANQGYGDMGAFVEAGYLAPLDSYADVYDWRDRYSKTLLELNSFSEDGKNFGKGNLYGVSQTGEIVGLFYNKKKLDQLGLEEPKTWADFTAQLKTIKSKGEQPIVFGNKDQYPAIHTYGMLQNRSSSKQDVVDTVFSRGDKSWDTPANEKAAATMQDWAKKGYLSKGANGYGYDQAAADFGKGKGVYLNTGTWLAGDLMDSMGKNVGFMAPPAAAGGDPYTTGGQGLSWSITGKSKNQDVAAAYLDFITNSHAADVVTESGGLPAMPPKSAEPESGTALAQIFSEWESLNESNNLVPYLDYTTPDFYDTMAAELQKLVGSQTTPKSCVQTIDEDYAKFQESK
ncbi:MAG: extracellular solute-binding protein [Streptosporangiales bacterium]|nr:extracellular solute-binding protein [Streptosporangiales bacterium]